MNALWLRYKAWFDARVRRERMILGFGVLGGLLLIGINYWVEPAFTEANKLSAQTRQNRQSAVEMEAQIALLQLQGKDPDAPLRSELEQVRHRIAEQEPRFKEVERSLVAANKVPEFLQGILARNHGLQLLSLHTLPPQPLIQREAAKPGEPVPAGEANIYKHGVQVRLAGSYHDLVAYMADLEKSPQRIIWGPMDVTVDEYPRSVLSLTVYTISLDKAWLTL